MARTQPQVSFTVKEGQYIRIKKFADKEFLSVSSFVRRLFLKGLDEQKH